MERGNQLSLYDTHWIFTHETRKVRDSGARWYPGLRLSHGGVHYEYRGLGHQVVALATGLCNPYPYPHLKP